VLAQKENSSLFIFTTGSILQLRNRTSLLEGEYYQPVNTGIWQLCQIRRVQSNLDAQPGPMWNVDMGRLPNQGLANGSFDMEKRTDDIRRITLDT
jgi:hypothetical protein